MKKMKQPGLPVETKIRILNILKKNYRITTEKMYDLAASAVGFEKRDKANRTYWLGKCQQLMSGIRDEAGYRMAFNIPKSKSLSGRSEYVLVCACTDERELAAIRHRLHGSINGLEKSIEVINLQLDAVKYISKQIDRAIENIWRDEE